MRSTTLPRHIELARTFRYALFFFAVLLISNIFSLPTASAARLPTQTNSPSLAWRHKCDAAIEADGAFAADGTFFVGCLGGTLYAIEPHAGRRLWQFKAGGAIFAAPLVAADGRSLLLSAGNSLYNISISNSSAGTVFWKFSADDWVYSSAAVANDGSILFGSFDTHIYALTSAGKLIWKFQTGGRVQSQGAVGPDGTVYFGSGDGRVYALRASDGSVQWSFLTGGPIAASCILSSDGVLYAPSFDRSVYALQTRGSGSGTALWNFTTDGPVVATPFDSSSTLLFGSSDGLLYALHTTPSPTLNWTFNSAAPLLSSGVLTSSGAVALGSGNKYFYVLDPLQGTTMFEYETGDSLVASGRVSADGKLLAVGSTDGYVYVFSGT